MLKVAIVDSDILTVEALSKVLQKINYCKIQIYSVDANRLFEICLSEQIDLVFFDYLSGNVSIQDLGWRLRKISPNTDLCVMLHSDHPDIIKEFVHIKAADYFIKPATQRCIEKIIQPRAALPVPAFSENLILLIQSDDYGKLYYGMSEAVTRIMKKIETQNPEKHIILLEAALRNRFSELGMDNEIIKWRKEILEKKTWKHWAAFFLSCFQIADALFCSNIEKKYPIFNTVFVFINQHIDESISLSDIIKNCCISQSYLSRIFKTECKVTVLEYLHMRKITRAKYYFYYYNFSATDAAYQLGYTESSYFGKVFKKYEHQTVLEYKKKLIKKVW